MTWLQSHIISLTVFLPTLGALVIALLPADKIHLLRRVAMVFSLLTFGLAVWLFTQFQGNADFQFVELHLWVPGYGISYHVGVDGISLLLIVLTAFLMPITILSTFKAVQDQVKGFLVSLLILQTGMIGVFVALDLFLFYIFWEMMLIPMYLLIGIWGGKRRLYAAIKFVLYTMIGSLLMLVAILALYSLANQQLGHYTTNYLELTGLVISPGVQVWLFLAFALSFAIKVPLFPFHTWLPDAHVEAPTAGSIILAGVLLKMGGYGFLRFCLPLFPLATQQFIPVIVALAVIGIIYGALVAMIQPDMKKLVAYSSVSHLGYVILGIFALTTQSVSGGVIQMINHGISTGALFLLVGVIYERTHSRMIADYGGLARVMPHFTVVFVIATLASIGMPGLNGFVGEFLIILGSFPTQPVAAVLAATGVILSASYMLWLVHRVFYGKAAGVVIELASNEGRKTDLSGREWAAILPLLAMMVWLGVYPKPFLDKIEPAVVNIVETYHSEVALIPEAIEVIELAADVNTQQEGSNQ